MDVLEQNEIETAVNHLGIIYVNQLDESMIAELKKKLFESGHESSYLVREIRELWKYDLGKLNSFLERYGVKEKSLLDSSIAKLNLVRNIPRSVFIEKQFKRQEPLEEFIFDEIKPPIEVIGEQEICDLKKVTAGMTEEEMVEYLRLHGKSAEQIVKILSMIQKLEKDSEIVFEQPKQMVLKNPKMAAFIDSLTLAFLVGAFSGILFFVVLRLFLNALY